MGKESLFKKLWQPRVVAHTFMPSTGEAEAGEFLFQDIQGYTQKPYPEEPQHYHQKPNQTKKNPKKPKRTKLILKREDEVMANFLSVQSQFLKQSTSHTQKLRNEGPEVGNCSDIQDQTLEKTTPKRILLDAVCKLNIGWDK